MWAFACLLLLVTSLNVANSQTCFGKTNPNACNGHGTCTSGSPDACVCAKNYHGCECQTQILDSFRYTDGTIRVQYISPINSIVQDFDLSTSKLNISEGGACSPTVEYLYDKNENIFPCASYFFQSYSVLGPSSSSKMITFDSKIHRTRNTQLTQSFTTKSSNSLSSISILALSSNRGCATPESFATSKTISLNSICYTPQNCSCLDSKLRAPYCTQFSCDGVDRNDSTVCTGRGTCISPNLCDCKDSGALGIDCEYFKCFDFANGTCGLNGDCVGPDICSCRNDMAGGKCQYVTCGGISSVEVESVCSGHGSCRAGQSGSGFCSCFFGYAGASCSRKRTYFMSGEIDFFVSFLVVVFLVPGGFAVCVACCACCCIYCCLICCSCFCLCSGICGCLCATRRVTKKKKKLIPMPIDGREYDDEVKKDIHAEEEFDPYRVRRTDEGTKFEFDGEGGGEEGEEEEEEGEAEEGAEMKNDNELELEEMEMNERMKTRVESGLSIDDKGVDQFSPDEEEEEGEEETPNDEVGEEEEEEEEEVVDVGEKRREILEPKSPRLEGSEIYQDDEDESGSNGEERSDDSGSEESLDDDEGEEDDEESDEEESDDSGSSEESDDDETDESD